MEVVDQTISKAVGGAWSQGEMAARQGLMMDANPYQVGTKFADFWDMGWVYVVDDDIRSLLNI